jgi:hypothetical protein
VTYIHKDPCYGTTVLWSDVEQYIANTEIPEVRKQSLQLAQVNFYAADPILILESPDPFEF